MKKIIKLTLLLLAFLLPATAAAHDFEVNGIYYNIDGSEATVTYRGTYPNSLSYTGIVVIPESVTYNGTTYSVTAIGDDAFFGCTGLTSITLPNSVTTIGDYAFYRCTGLTSITMPNCVTTIGDDAFSGCAGLTSITIPNFVTTIGDDAFSGCTGLTSITIGNGVTAIGDYAFKGCTSLDTINFNAVSCNNFNSGESHPFYNSNISTISTINIGNSVERIPAYFANGLTKLTSITIPNSVTTIGNYAFQYCI